MFNKRKNKNDRKNHTDIAGIGALPNAGIEFNGDGDGNLELEDFGPSIGFNLIGGFARIWHR